MTPVKLRFYAESDVFVFRDQGKIVGLLVAHPTDWSCYYMRSLVLLPAYRGRGLIGPLTEHLAEALGPAGVERIDCDVAPVNVACLTVSTRLGFIPRGTLNTDRWGALVRLTKYVRPEAEDVFHEQFCAGRWPRCRTPSSMGPGRRAS